MRIFDAKSTEASKAEERVDVKEKGIYEEVPEKSYGGYQYRWNYDTYQHKLQNKKRKAANRGLKRFSVVMCSVFLLCSGVIAGVIICEFLYRDQNNVGRIPAVKQTGGKVVDPTVEPDLPRSPLTMAEIVNKGKSFVVGLFSPTEQESQVGTGIVLTGDGYVVTNYHAVKYGVDIQAETYNGARYETQLVGFDEASDVALLKIVGDGFTAAEIGRMREISVGDEIVVIGMPDSPESDIGGGIVNGIVSEINENISFSDSANGRERKLTVLHTTASADADSTGGPVLNKYGEVIGMNTAALSENYEGQGTAISMKQVISIANEILVESPMFDEAQAFIINTGNTIGKIGVNGEDIDEYQALLYKVPQGILVRNVEVGANAAQVGLQRGDIIVNFNGASVRNMDNLTAMEESCEAGQKVCLTVYRIGEMLDLYFYINAASDFE